MRWPSGAARRIDKSVPRLCHVSVSANMSMVQSLIKLVIATDLLLIDCTLSSANRRLVL